jgi:hypothetical protein
MQTLFEVGTAVSGWPDTCLSVCRWQMKEAEGSTTYK